MTQPTATILRHIRSLLVTQAARESSDRQLLERFGMHGDEHAFAALLHRHGGLVWGVCRHILRHEQDAEDAFQATFLLLAKRARSIRKAESVGSWLYGVAYRVAMRAKKQRGREKPLADMVAVPADNDHPDADELQAVIDEELRHLPEKQRLAFILCCVEGRSRKDAAQQLGWHEGTLASRLDRARKGLQKRLCKRGIAPVLVTGLISVESYAAPPAALIAASLRGCLLVGTGKAMPAGISLSALSLMHVTARAMLVGKGMWACGLLLVVGLLAGGVQLLARSPMTAIADAQVASEQKSDPETAAVPKIDSLDRQTRTDSNGDPLPEGAIARLGTVRLRHGGVIDRMLFTPDGRTLISRGADGVRTWDTASGKQRLFIPRENRRTFPNLLGWPMGVGASAVPFSKDGALCAMDTGEGVLLVTTATGKPIRTIGQGPYWDLALSADGKILATQDGNKHEITLWDTASGRALRTWPSPKTFLADMMFAPGNKTLITVAVFRQGKASSEISFWDVASGKERKRVEAGPWDARKTALSPDGRILAALGSGEKGWQETTIRTWNVATGNRLCDLNPGTGTSANWIQAVAFGPDSKTLYADGLDGSVHAWDAESGEERSRTGANVRRVRALALSGDGESLAVAGTTAIRLLERKTGKDRLPGLRGIGSFAVVGGRIATCDGTQVSFWDAKTGKELEQVDVSPSGSAMIRMMRGRQNALCAASEATRDLLTGKMIPNLKAGIHVWSISRDRKLAALRDKPDETSVVELSTGRQLWTFGTQGEQIFVAEFLGGTRELIVCAGDQKVHRWDLATGRKIASFAFVDEFADQLRLRFAGGPNVTLAYASTVSPDENTIAFGTQTGLILLHDIRSGRLLRKIGKLHRGAMAIAFSPDSRSLAWGGWFDGIRLIEAATGKERARFSGHLGGTNAVAFLDSSKFASGWEDNSVLIWNLTGVGTGKPDKSLTPAELARCWDELTVPDAAPAYAAMRKLWADPVPALAFIKDHLQPVAPLKPAYIPGLLRDLANDQFAVRQRATVELSRLGHLALPACRKALEKESQLEARRRIEALLEKMLDDWHNPTGESLRALRAVEVLETTGSPEALAKLETLARGAPEARLTQEARGSLRRVKPG